MGREGRSEQAVRAVHVLTRDSKWNPALKLPQLVPSQRRQLSPAGPWAWAWAMVVEEKEEMALADQKVVGPPFDIVPSLSVMSAFCQFFRAMYMVCE